MPNAYKHMLGFFQLVNDVPGYEEMEPIRPPESKRDAGWVEGEEKGRDLDRGLNGEAKGEAGQNSQNGTMQTDGNGNAGRPNGRVEEVDEDEGEVGKID